MNQVFRTQKLRPLCLLICSIKFIMYKRFLPAPLILPDPTLFSPPPSDESCQALWDKYAMLPNVREHSLLVADIAAFVGTLAEQAGIFKHTPFLRASAMMHDLAKTYTILNGGNHCQLGSAWCVQELKNPVIAQGVAHHVDWPWGIDIPKYFIPLTLIYCDKRVMHNRMVSLDERCEDLLRRYGLTEIHRDYIRHSIHVGLDIEMALSDALGVDLSAYTIDNRRLV